IVFTRPGRYHHCRHLDGEGGPFARLAFDAHIAAHHLAKMTRNRQTKTTAAVLARRRGIRLRERLEQFVHLVLGHANARVADAEDEMSDAIAALSLDLQGNRSLVRKFALVAEEVEQT